MKDIPFKTNEPMALPTWGQVRTLGYYTLIRFSETLKLDAQYSKQLKANVVTNYADELLKDLEKQPYHTVMGKNAKDYSWGSSSVAANQGIALLYAYKIS
jgi:endoglucanase